MSYTIIKTHNGHEATAEVYDSLQEVVENCKKRNITDQRFDDMENKYLDEDWHGVKSYDEALCLMRDGWSEKVDVLQKALDHNKTISQKRISFQNDIVGFAPVVPLAIINVPNAMINTRIKPIKSKIISIYYNMGITCFNDAEQIEKNGRKIIEAITNLENSGYRVNLFSIQSYAGYKDSDVLAVKVKDARQPLDLKRVCFPIMHPAMFRVIGFDWYSKFPKGKYRDGYGAPLSQKIGEERAQEMFRVLFGEEAVFLNAPEIQEKDTDYIISRLKGEKK